MKKKFFPILREQEVQWLNVNKLRAIEICNKGGIRVYNKSGQLITNVPKDSIGYEVTLSHLIELGILPTLKT